MTGGVKKILARLRAENFLPLLCVVIKCGKKKAVILHYVHWLFYSIHAFFLRDSTQIFRQNKGHSKYASTRSGKNKGQWKYDPFKKRNFGMLS